MALIVVKIKRDTVAYLYKYLVVSRWLASEKGNSRD